jgi:hypothetical protein
VKVELEVEEVSALLVFLTERFVEEAGLDAGDAAKLASWRSTMTPGSQGMRDLTAKLNADLARRLENKRRSSVIKPDWR